MTTIRATPAPRAAPGWRQGAQGSGAAGPVCWAHGSDEVQVTPTDGRPLAATPLGRTVATTPTDIWNDSCSIPELEYAISFGAVGATANPTIVNDVWREDPGYWRDRVRELAGAGDRLTEVDIAWAVVEEMSVRAAPLLLPAHAASDGRQGRLSMQTDPTFYRSPDRMVAQGRRFADARAEHHRQVPGDPGRHRRDRGGDRRPA